MNFRQLDLNLLRVLVAIHRTGRHAGRQGAGPVAARHQQRAGAPARFFKDELFVRAPAGLEPTRLCEQLAPAVMAQLSSMEGLVTGHEKFDPGLSKMQWQLSLSDLGEMLVLPGLAGELRKQAPDARLSNISVAAN